MKLINFIQNIYNAIVNIFNNYPRQYWLMIAGIIIATAGGGMIWPFMLIYAKGKLNLPLSSVSILVSINAGMGLFSSVVAGALADRIGRKGVMIFSLSMTGIAYYLLAYAQTYAQFAGLMVMIGLSNPMYQVGADAMLADMIPSEKRTDAYAINRIGNNAGFAIGPAVGGFLAASSYSLAFFCACLGFLTYSVLLLFFARETLDRSVKRSEERSNPIGGFFLILGDKSFMAFVLLISLGLIAPLMMWILMPVYANTNFGIPENQYGWIPTTNALMCVFIQYFVTLVTRKRPTLPVLTAGMLIYALGAGSVALMSSFWGFWLSMVILTFGELTLVPTATKYVADLAPEDMRGRYMSIHWLGWGGARMLAPIIGGFLNDSIAPVAIWIGGFTFGLISTFGLFLLSRLSVPKQTLPAEA